MDVAVQNKKQIKKGARKHRRGQLPTKRTINLATLGEKKMNYLLAIPSILLILIAAAVFSKFLVIDRMAEVSAAQAEVRRLQTKLDQGYEELTDFDDLSNLYAHYTYSGFTSEELKRADRVAVLELIDRLILPYAQVDSWTLSGNELTVNMTGSSLQQINLIVQQLERDELVDFCTVNTANTNDNTRNEKTADEFSEVRARVLAYLNSAPEVNKG